MAYTLRQDIERQLTGPCLLLMLHERGAHVIVGNSLNREPEEWTPMPWYAVVEDDHCWAREHFANGRTPWSALKKAALSWAKERRELRNRDVEE